MSWTEEERLAALGRYEVLDTPPERDFDDLVRLAADLLDAPIATVTLVDASRQWFKSEVGLGVRETPLESSICAHAIHRSGSTVVPDLTGDPAFAANPDVTGDRHLRFYAGETLETPEGLPLGMLCVLDTKPRPQGLTRLQHFALVTLARQVTAQLELRRALAEQRRADALSRQIIDTAGDHAIIAIGLDGLVTRWNAGAELITGWPEPGMLGQPLARIFTDADIADGRVAREMRRALDEGSSPDKRWHRRRNGELFWADGQMRPITGDAGRPVGFVKVFSDRSVERQAEQRLTLLAEASAGLLAASDPDDVLGPLLERGAELLGFDRSRSYTMNEDGTALRLTRSTGPGALPAGQPSTSADHPFCSIVAATRLPLILRDLQTSPEPHGPIGRAAGLAAYAGFPVLAGDKLHGVLSFGSATRSTFDDETLAFFTTLARFLAVVRQRLDGEKRLRELNLTLEQRVEERTRERDRVWQVSRDMLGVADGSGVWLSVNPAWTRILGWAADRIIGQTSSWLEPPEDCGKMSASFARLAAGQATDAFENRLRAREGSDRLLSWTAVAAEGCVYCVARDVTVERARERALRESEDFTRLTLSAVGGVGAWTYDVAADRFTCDPAIAEIYGHDRLEAASGIDRERFLANIHPDDLPRLLRTMENGLLRSGELELEYRIRQPDGSVRWILSRGHTYFDATGKPVRRTGVGVETTRQRNLEEQLRQAQKMEAIGQLTGGLAHDFNNLLTGIVGSLELLQTRVTQGRTEGALRYIEAAQGAARRASALTHRLLAFSRRQTLDPKPTDANRLMAGMEDLIRRTMGPEITVEMSGSRDLWNILVDSSQLESALLNLCINARDAMPGGGKLVVETANRWLGEPAAAARGLAPGAYVSLGVSDDGVGMPPEIAARAFDPFFTTKPTGQGTGLGLSMTYGFVRQSGGQVRIHSSVGDGTTVSLLLPRHLGEAEAAASPANLRDAPRAEQDQAVLVVDDEPTVRMLVTDVLEDLGYTALEAGDGAVALRTLRSRARIDLLVTDVGLPGGMNGRQLADAARVARPGLKVLFITGYAENAVLSHGHLDPGMHVLTKPFAMEALASQIKALLVGRV